MPNFPRPKRAAPAAGANRAPLKRPKPELSEDSEQPGRAAPPNDGASPLALRRSRHWRLIVRNLPFSATEAEIREKFAEHGPLLEVVVPKSKKDPARAAGFAFVQFAQKGAANLAMGQLNGTKIGNRPVAVDWAVPKDDYEANRLQPGMEKKKLREILADTSADTKPHAKFETSAERGDCEQDSDSDSADEDSNDGNSDNEQAGSSGHVASDSDDQGKDEGAAVHDKQKQNQMKAREEREDKGIGEGRTLFIRNLSFDTTDEKLKKAFKAYGKLNYALVCKHKGTDHSKGSGFVQFTESSDAAECLERLQKEPLVLDERQVLVCTAVRKIEAKTMERAKLDKAPKDNRNLHLVRVSLIRPGTAAANNMSEADANRRTAIDLANRTKLKNLHVFVSPTRLVVHNLPRKVDDKRLRDICVNAVQDKGARIIECRVWRDLTQLDANGVGRSRGFAFVNFTHHQHALRCLKELNNNPSIFSDEKRPIVEFSLENRVALNKKVSRHSNQDSNTAGETVDDDPMVEQTKSLMRSHKLKPFPSHVGEKRRHNRPAAQNSKVPKKKIDGKLSRKERRGVKAGVKSEQKVGRETKRTAGAGKVKRKGRVSVTKMLTGGQ